MIRIALRLLLAVSLVLTGVGNAVAAVSMTAQVVGSHHAALASPATEPAAAAACQHRTVGTEVVGQATDDAQSSAQSTDCEKDCCTKGECECPCLQLAQATLLDVAFVAASIGHLRMASGFPVAFAPPALPHPIRPPIG